jgi:hypothetical protein
LRSNQKEPYDEDPAHCRASDEAFALRILAQVDATISDELEPDIRAAPFTFILDLVIDNGDLIDAGFTAIAASDRHASCTPPGPGLARQSTRSGHPIAGASLALAYLTDCAAPQRPPSDAGALSPAKE